MDSKLYIVHCKDIEVFNTFVSIIENRIIAVKHRDYSNIKFNTVIKGVPNQFSPFNKNDVQLTEKIAKILNDYNNSIFNKLVADIKIFDYNRIQIFIRVDNLKDVNKLKRHFKRPNYKTVLIDTHNSTIKCKQGLKNYKFDSRIQYVNNSHLLTQAKLFITKHIPTIKRLKN